MNTVFAFHARPYSVTDGRGSRGNESRPVSTSMGRTVVRLFWRAQPLKHEQRPTAMTPWRIHGLHVVDMGNGMGSGHPFSYDYESGLGPATSLGGRKAQRQPVSLRRTASTFEVQATRHQGTAPALVPTLEGRLALVGKVHNLSMGIAHGLTTDEEVPERDFRCQSGERQCIAVYM